MELNYLRTNVRACVRGVKGNQCYPKNKYFRLDVYMVVLKVKTSSARGCAGGYRDYTVKTKYP